MIKRLLALLMALTLLLCASCSLMRSKEESLIRDAWKSIGESHRPQWVYIMRYNNRSELSNEVLDSSLYRRIPTSGYAVIFSQPEGEYGFYGMHTVFLNETGEVLYTFDYSDHYDLYQRTKPSYYSIYNVSQIDRATGYLEECNYFAGMQNFAHNDSESTRNEKLCKQANVWYSLTEKQIKNLTK